MKSEPQEVEQLLEWTFRASDQFMQAFMLCGVMKIEYSRLSFYIETKNESVSLIKLVKKSDIHCSLEP